MKVTMWMRQHRRSLMFLALMLTLGGLMAAFRMPVSLFPDVSFPRVRITLDAGDRPATQMTVQVTTPIEDAVRDVRGVRDVRSTTSRGSAEIQVRFDWGSDMGRALLNVNAAVYQALPDLPAGTRVSTERMDPVTYPILAYSLRSDTLTPTQLHDLATYQLRPLLSSIPGVAHIGVQGGTVGEYHVDVDMDRLRARGLTLADLDQAVSRAATIRAMGRIQDHYKLFLLLANNQPETITKLRDIVVSAGPGGVVHVGDVAKVRLDHVPQWIRVVADGKDAVLLQVYQQPSGNSVQIARDVKQRLANYALPPHVKIANWYDQTQLVKGAAVSVRDAIGIGVILAGLVLLVFLRNARVILVAMIVVPAVLAITVLLLSVLHMSFNMMTLGGMAAAVGLIVDDVMVMLEHIMRRLRDGTGHVHERIAGAAWEFTRPLTGSSAATVIIFLPLAFLSGITGAFFKALSLTMASALIISWVLNWVIVPLLANWLIDERHAHEPEPSRLTRRLQAGYEKLLDTMVRRPLLILVAVLPLLALGGLAYTRVSTGFMPQMDEGGFILDYISRPGTSLTETNRLLDQVGKILKANPYVSTYSRRTGLQLGGGLTEANTGDYFVRLKDGDRPPIQDIMEQVRTQVNRQVPGLDIDLSQLMEDLIGDLTEVPQPIEIKIFGDKPQELSDTARRVAKAIGGVPGVVDVLNGINPAGDALDVHVDANRAALAGLTPDQVTAQVRDAIAGTVAADLPQGPKMIGVRVWLPVRDHARVEQLKDLPIRGAHGRVLPLSQLARIQEVNGQPEIDRDNLKRMVAVTARINGRGLGSTIADVKHVLAEPGMVPTGMYYQLGGLYAQQQKAFHDLTLVLVAAIALVFTLLLFLYESFRVALSILAMPLLALSMVFIGLWVTGIQLNITAIMGMTMIVGIVTELAIFYFSEYEEARQHMDSHAARQYAGRHRMRPILMSTIAAILTLMPLALALGRGAQMQQPLAVAIISGMLVQVPLVLVLMPALHALMTGEAGRKAQS